LAQSERNEGACGYLVRTTYLVAEWVGTFQEKYCAI